MAGVMLSENAARRLGPVVRWVERQPTNETQKRKGPQDQDAGGCDSQNAIWDISIAGKPTGGTWDLYATVNGVTTTLTFDWNDSASDIQTVLETHSEIAASEAIVTGGPAPNATIRVEFKLTLANTDISIPRASWSSLTGGVGVVIICALAQKGHE